VWVETKSTGLPARRACASRSPTHSARADPGPPTRSRRSTALTARAASSYSRKYSAWLPVQNTSRFASFHTSNAQVATSSMP
jgi:hypothetical protein